MESLFKLGFVATVVWIVVTVLDVLARNAARQHYEARLAGTYENPINAERSQAALKKDLDHYNRALRRDAPIIFVLGVVTLVLFAIIYFPWSAWATSYHQLRFL